MYNPFHPPPAPPAFGQDSIVPEERASIFSRLIFSWLDPLLKVGFSRPLQKEDLWQLPDDMLTNTLSEKVELAFYNRCTPERRPISLRPRAPSPSSSRTRRSSSQDEKASADVKDVQDEKTVMNVESAGDNPDGKKQPAKSSKRSKKEKYDESLLMALHETFFWRWWIGGILTLVGNILTTVSPLVNKLLLTWLTLTYEWHRLTPEERVEAGLQKPKGVGYGIGVAFAIFIMQEAASVITCHYQLLTMTTGLEIRTSVIGAIFRKSLRLSGRSRIEHSVGRITTMISTDAMRLERVTAFAHNLWVSPIQLIIGVALVIWQLGYSALVGLGVIVLSFPLQTIAVKMMFNARKRSVAFTDKRVRLVTEILQGIRLIKYYVWEDFYSHQVWKVRQDELANVRQMGMGRALLVSVVSMVPVLSAVLSFITYALSGHDLNIATIFTALQFFNIIQAPLRIFPMVMALSTDAAVALKRTSAFLLSEELAEPYFIDESKKLAISCQGDFTWETSKRGEDKFSRGGPGSRSGAKKAGPDRKSRLYFWKKDKKDVLPTAGEKEGDKLEKEKEEDKPFQLNNLELKIARGTFVAIVGTIGSGKSSVLQALIGEMRKIKGQDTVFNSSVAYVPQTPWIMNATLRENITFGQPDEEEKFQGIVDACCLRSDLEMLPHGEKTEIGEKGINLSGGQKARVSLARAAYSNANIILMDDSLSAVDAHVGKALLENCLLSGPLAGKTRVLVTHALHVLDKTDYIYVMDQGVIAEQGSYNDLMNNSVIFSRLMEEFGSLEKEEEENIEAAVIAKDKFEVKEDKESSAAKPLMQAEERVTGAVTFRTYGRYFRYAGGIIWAVILIALMVLYQGAQVANNIFLGFWTGESLSGFSQGDYMGTYAGLGIASAIFSFLLSFSITITTIIAGARMFRDALDAVLHSPVSFFDTTPLGRMMSRLSSDQDTIDFMLSMNGFMLVTSISSVIGTIALVFYTFPYLGILFVPLFAFYYLAAIYYRRTSVEAKRLDSLMRSALYAAYSESLTGLSTIRAYGAQGRFVTKSEHGLDMENRAYYMTVAIQSWLGTRLDTLGNILVLGIALFAAGFSNTVNPSKIGVVLSYTLSVTSVFSMMVTQYATNEQNFNCVERILHYTSLPSEGARETPNDPPASWPEKGQIDFKDVELCYRPGLPPVLKGVAFTINPGEKIGIVGRTGAGKSSLLQALFRMVNISGGVIEIDGVDTSEIGLDVLRGRLALVPQDALLFKGTLRENLDPEGTRTDAELISALQRGWLLPRDGSTNIAAESKFNLDAVVSDEGSNYSAGEKQLLALCRALVKNSRVIVLDEATSNVDVELDSKLQTTIQTEFSTSTLLCIAHRLNTIVYYDRILVMDAGQVAEFDTPLNLFGKEDSIFRSLCDEANLSRADIERIRASVAGPVTALA